MFSPLNQYQAVQNFIKEGVMNTNLINNNDKDTLALRALLNITRSYKILISPIMATLKPKHVAVLRSLYQTHYVLCLTDAYRLLTTSVSYSSSAKVHVILTCIVVNV